MMALVSLATVAAIRSYQAKTHAILVVLDHLAQKTNGPLLAGRSIAAHALVASSQQKRSSVVLAQAFVQLVQQGLNQRTQVCLDLRKQHVLLAPVVHSSLLKGSAHV